MILKEASSHKLVWQRRIVCVFRFVPEAAIVNYYHLDSTLSGHTDHSEKDLSIPLLSVRLDGIPPPILMVHNMKHV